MKIKKCLFRDGKRRAVTFSYDDGRVTDRELVKIFDDYGAKGTFHLNSGYLRDKADNEADLGDNPYLETRELAFLFKNHEIACHTSTHPDLTTMTRENILSEIMLDKQKLEQISEYPVCGMSYPYGTYNETIKSIARSCGIVYSRTIKDTHNFHLPDDFLEWHPTAHQSADLEELYARFSSDSIFPLPCFYIWGHAHEFRFKNNKSKDHIKMLLEKSATDNSIWFATNIEIYQYKKVLDSLVFSFDQKLCHNPSCISVWIEVNGEPRQIQPGLNTIEEK